MDDRGPLFNTQIVKPEWFKEAALEAETHFRLVNGGILPRILVGNFTVTMCLRLLRCVFGLDSNLETVERLKNYVIESEAYWRRTVQLDDSKN